MYGPLIFIRCCACIFRTFGKEIGPFSHKCEHSVKHKWADGVELLEIFLRCWRHICSCFGCQALSLLQLRRLISKKKLPVSSSFLVTSVGLTLDFIDNALLPFSWSDVWNKTSTSDSRQLILSHQIWHALLEIQSHLLDNLHSLWHDFTPKLICWSTTEGGRCFMPANGARPVSQILNAF